MSGPVIGDGLIFRDEHGVLTGRGQWCGFPFVAQLEVTERRGKKGYRMVLRAAPPGDPDPDAPMPMPGDK